MKYLTIVLLAITFTLHAGIASIGGALTLDDALQDSDISGKGNLKALENGALKRPGFTDITDSSRTAGPAHFGGHGVMWADVTGDGLPDCYVTMNFQPANMGELFYRNTVGNVFAEEAAQRGIEDLDTGSHGGVWADLNNDGYYDLVNGGFDRNRVFQNNGSGFFTDRTATSGFLDVRYGTRGVVAFDADNDGHLDVLCNNWWVPDLGHSEPNEFYFNQGNFSFVSADNGLANVPSAQGVTVGDYDNDGDLDVVICRWDGPVTLMQNNDGIFTAAIRPEFDGTSPRQEGATFADVNNDSWLDLHVQTGDYIGSLFINNQDGSFTRKSPPQGTGFMAGFEDLNNDGTWDMVYAGDDKVYYNDGSGNFTASVVFDPRDIKDPRAVAFADIDNDGDMDFFYAQKRTHNRLIRNDLSEPDTNWLKIKLVSSNGQCGAFGTKVRIYQSGKAGDPSAMTSFREARSQEGYLAQNDPVLHFGLGNRPTVDAQATFLDGTIATRSHLAAGQVVTFDARETGMNRTAHQWLPTEFEVGNPSYSGNPFDLLATATFVHGASGETRTTGMFYAGGNTWKFRFTGTRPGLWNFKTSSDDPDLNNLSGAVTVQPAGEDQYGFVSHQGSKWVRAKGPQGTSTAFVPQYVMYAHPAAFYNHPERIDKDIRTFLVQHGFNGFHFGVSCRWFDISKTASHEIDDDDPNPDFRTFEALELLINKVHEAGGVVHMWAWGDEQRRMTPVKWGVNGVVDKRLQRYIAARLGPLPGWTMGYGFDLWEWTESSELAEWHDYLHQHFGWPHLLGTRNFQQNIWEQLSETLDYSSYEHWRPDYDMYVKTIEDRPTKPSFSEDRFRIRDPSPYPEKDYTEEMTRRGLWHSAMAGGVANIWGNLVDAPSDWSSNPYPHPHWSRTYADLFENRFLVEMVRDNTITDGVCLRTPDSKRFIFYRENTDAITMDLSGMPMGLAAVAVDTTQPYKELSLGILRPGNHTWTAPHTSDWAIAVEGEQ
ncbi:MAG: FG-GAP-like repeat-containing protein [Pirellulaceae bacterium]